MVQVCPKCGTRDPDEGAVFCNRCGNRLPPPVPEKKEKICPGCDTKISDIHAVFCDRCGSPLPATPPKYTGAPPAAARPVISRERCPSCGAPFVDEISEYCNVCGANLRVPAPVSAAVEHDQPSPEKPGPGTPVADMPGDGSAGPEPEKSRMSRLKGGLAAGVAVIALLIIAASFSGMIPGMNQSPDATPAPALPDQSTGTPLTTPVMTETAAPALTPSPAETTAPPVPTTVATTITPATGTTMASATVTVNASVPGAANASRNVTTTLTITSSSQPLSVGQSAYDGKGNLTVNGFAFRDKMSDPTPSYAIGKQYLIVNITYENLDQNGTVDADLSRMKVTDGGGYSYEPASDVLLENVYLGTPILPREKRTGNLLFIVPPQAMYLNLEYRFGNQTSVKFLLT